MNIWFDLKHGWRLTAKSWGYSLMCASVVALSVGLAIWMSEVAYGQLFRPLGFPGSERWYSLQVSADAKALAKPSIDAYTYQELVKHNHSVNYLGAFSNRDVVFSEGEVSATLRAAAINPGLLAAAQVAPGLGRRFEETDGQPGAAPVAILSFDTWQNYFAADPGIIGKTARIDSAPVQIIGVMPKGFYQFQDFELWLPLQIPNLAQASESALMVSPVIGLGKDQKTSSILSEMKPTVDGVNGDYPELFNSARHVSLVPALRMFTAAQTPILAAIGFLCAAVLLLGCVDISMVFLARLLERSRELALRTALGASRARLLSQCLLETSLVVPLGLLGGYGFGVMVFRWGRGMYNFTSQILAGGRPPYLPSVRGVDMVVAVIAAVTIWCLSTLIPAWRITKQDAAVVLAGSGKGTSVRVSNKSAGVLVGLQVVVSCLVLVISGSMVLAIKKELSKPKGVTTANMVISTYPTAFDKRYSEPAQRVRYWDDMAAAIANRLPGAEAAFITSVPTRPVKVPAAIETQQGTDHEGRLTLPLAVVSDNYFQMLGISARSGRLFDSTDDSTSLKVAIVDEQMAKRYWPNQDALGKRLQLKPADNGPWLTVVGVVSAVQGKPYSNDFGVIYQPLRQAAPSEFQLLVKLPNTGAESRAALHAAAFSVDRDLPLHNLQTLDDYLSAVDLSYIALIPTFIAVALMTALMAAAGLFGLISRSVAQRTQEVGIRRALGATTWQATSMFLRQGALYLSVGIAGIALGTMLSNLISAFITNILDHVILVVTSVLLLMAGVIFSASHLPSRRAVALEPGDALRYE